MKTRNGFVSNSSSSSFILALNKPIEDYSSYEEFAEDYEIDDYFKEYGNRLYTDLKNYDTIIDEDDIVIDLYSNILTEEEQDEIISQIKQYAVELIKNKTTEKKNNAKYIIEYSDDDRKFDSVMEHDFMPKFKGTVKIISHH